MHTKVKFPCDAGRKRDCYFPVIACVVCAGLPAIDMVLSQFANPNYPLLFWSCHHFPVFRKLTEKKFFFSTERSKENLFSIRVGDLLVKIWAPLVLVLQCRWLVSGLGHEEKGSHRVQVKHGRLKLS